VRAGVPSVEEPEEPYQFEPDLGEIAR